jgi:hypothetical protein
MLITVYTAQGPVNVLGIALNESHADLIPLLASIAYLAASVLFYSVRIGKSFLKLTK